MPGEGERRGASRIRVNLSARYCSDTLSLSGQVCDLSRDGMFLRSEFLDQAGASAQVVLNLPGLPSPLHLTGRVVRVVQDPSGPGMGIHFHGLARGVRRTLANFMIERSYQSPA